MSGLEDTNTNSLAAVKVEDKTTDEPLANIFVFRELKSALTFFSYKGKKKQKGSEWEEKLKFQKVITWGWRVGGCEVIFSPETVRILCFYGWSFVKQKESIREEHFRIREVKRCYIHYFKYLGY